MAIEHRDSLLTVPEVAEQLRVHPITVRRYISSGRLRAVRLGGGAVRVRESDIAKFLAPHRSPGRAFGGGLSAREMARRKRIVERARLERERTPALGITTAELVRQTRASREWMYDDGE